ncbi:MAG TPA: hypothetical protein PLL10_00410 [Elusimicrobiales bacterium]|nr:hypothetical protein [Elusimicrobiales bacterium]
MPQPTPDSQIVPAAREDVVEPEIVYPGGEGFREGAAAAPRMFVKVYRPGPLGVILAGLLGTVLLVAVFFFGTVALLFGGAVGLLWLLLSPLFRLFQPKR